MKVSGNKKLYSVMVQFENPMYNRLAVYDSELNLLLLDKSLNGNISISFSKDNGPYLKAVEGFISKDLINLKRISLYKLDTAAVYLSFRSYLSLSKPDMFLSQEIEHMSEEMIVTNIIFPGRMIDSARKDTFLFNSQDHIYQSKKGVFDSLVINQVNSHTIPTFLPELIDSKTIRNNY